MRHSGRHRMKTHAGIPQGSTCNLSNTLELYFQYRTGETGEAWADQGPHGRNALQESSENQPGTEHVPIGGLDFEDTNDESTSSMMDFEALEIGEEADFLMFIVWNPESIGASAYLSDSTSEVFQQTSGNVTLFKTSGATSSMNHSSTFTISAGVKSLFMIHRTEGSSGTITLYKNGLRYNPSVTDVTAFNLQNLGSKNDASNWFDGIIYDVGIISGAGATVRIRDMITDYLCSKHGINRLGNY